MSSNFATETYNQATLKFWQFFFSTKYVFISYYCWFIWSTIFEMLQNQGLWVEHSSADLAWDLGRFSKLDLGHQVLKVRGSLQHHNVRNWRMKQKMPLLLILMQQFLLHSDCFKYFVLSEIICFHEFEIWYLLKTKKCVSYVTREQKVWHFLSWIFWSKDQKSQKRTM